MVDSNKSIRAVPHLKVELSVVTIRTICFNIPQLGILRTQCINVFGMVVTTNSDCFPKQH
jgi:hypothetical protein